jgi:hypothetical protein
MDGKGSAAFVYFMIGILFFVLALALAPSLTDTTNQARNSDNLDCSNSSISNQDKSVCYQVDSMPPLYLAFIFGLGGIILTRLLG